MSSVSQGALAEIWCDEPVPYVLTDLGEWATSGWLTTDEAAAMLGLTRDAVAAVASRGALAGRKVGYAWLVDRESIEDYRRDRLGRGRRTGATWSTRRPRTFPRLPAEPLLRLIDARGGIAACGVRPGSAEEMAIYRARRQGSVTYLAADKLAVRVLGLVPGEIWDID